jgi:hypothetical protein
MQEEAFDSVKVYRAPNAKFYVTRQDHIICTQTGGLRYFEAKRDVQEFLAEVKIEAAPSD